MSYNPFSNPCPFPANEGKIRRLRLAYTADVFVQDLQTDIELFSQARFLVSENWLADWDTEDYPINDFKITDIQDEHGRKPDGSFSIKISKDILPSNFQRWWRAVKRRHLMAEITNWNDTVHIMNPLEINYEYVQPDNLFLPAYYLFSFKPTRFAEPSQDLQIVPAIMSAVPACHDITDAIESVATACQILDIQLKTIVLCQR